MKNHNSSLDTFRIAFLFRSYEFLGSLHHHKPQTLEFKILVGKPDFTGTGYDHQNLNMFFSKTPPFLTNQKLRDFRQPCSTFEGLSSVIPQKQQLSVRPSVRYADNHAQQPHRLQSEVIRARPVNPTRLITPNTERKAAIAFTL